MSMPRKLLTETSSTFSILFPTDTKFILSKSSKQGTNYFPGLIPLEKFCPRKLQQSHPVHSWSRTPTHKVSVSVYGGVAGRFELWIFPGWKLPFWFPLTPTAKLSHLVPVSLFTFYFLGLLSRIFPVSLFFPPSHSDPNSSPFHLTQEPKTQPNFSRDIFKVWRDQNKRFGPGIPEKRKIYS